MPFLQESLGVTVNNSTLIDVNGSHHSINFVASDKRKGEGIELLLNFCVHQAIHDSSARGDLGCHPGTREEYIRHITSWGNGEWNSGSEKRAFLMTGPAGAGKSAIARTCAHKMRASGNLAASFFFYRPTGWNDPMKFIPTIVYQLTTRYPAFRDCIDAVILDDRFVLEKAMDVQFRELLVEPLKRLNDEGRGVGKDTVIIVDGLDECATVEAQIEIIKLATTSILQRTTPFLWAFFSRPEPSITSAFSSDAASNISWKLPLTLSGTADSDIEAYICGSFETIRSRYNIPPDVAWPREENILRLISQSAGLFIYPATALKYIGSGTSGLEERLRSVLELGPPSTENPFSALDRLYMLIMMPIPEGVLFDTMSLLFLSQDARTTEFESIGGRHNIHDYQSALGLSPAAFYAAIGNLYSVLEVTKSRNGTPRGLKFYHKSFLDFLFDKTRSERYFLRSPSALQHCLKKLVQHMADVAFTDPSEADEENFQFFPLQLFFTTVEELDGQLEESILQQMLRLNWGQWGFPNEFSYMLNIRKFIQKIPSDWRHRIIRPSRIGLSGIPWQILANINPEKYKADSYVIGEGDRKAFMVPTGRMYDEEVIWYELRHIP